MGTNGIEQDVRGKSKVQLCLITKTDISETTSAESSKKTLAYFAPRHKMCHCGVLNIDEKSTETGKTKVGLVYVLGTF